MSTDRDMPRPFWRATASFALVGMIASSFAPAFSEPVHPSWWSSRGVTNSKAPNNKAVATVAQVKHISTMAREELEVLLPGGAGFSLPFPEPPQSPDPAWYQKQKKVLTLGQLKACAYPIYQKLNSISTVWVKQQLEANGLALGSTYHQDGNGYYYPWNPLTPVAVNKSVATLAQLKLVFCLRLGENLDGDGAIDLLELAALGSTAADVTAAQAQQLQSSGATPNSDTDGDGLTNAEEVAMGTSFDTVDSDSDGVIDGQDADPKDNAVRWTRVDATNYAAIELGNPFSSQQITDNDGAHEDVLGLTALGHDGRVAASISIPADDPGNGDLPVPPVGNIVTRIWLPSTGAWSNDLSVPAYLRANGFAFASNGDLYGGAWASLGANEEFPGVKPVPVVWKWQSGSYQSAIIDGGIDADVGATFSTLQGAFAKATGDEFDGAAPPRLAVPVGQTGRYLLTFPQEADDTAYHRHADTSSHQIALFDRITDTDDRVFFAGHGSGWGGYTKVTYDTQGAETLDHKVEWMDGTNVTTVNGPSATKVIGEIAGIDTSRVSGNQHAVVWVGATTTSSSPQVYVGYGTQQSNISWVVSERNVSDPLVLRGKINARGECLPYRGNYLLRNAQRVLLDDLVDSTKWENLVGVDINDRGMLLVTAIKKSSSQREALLLLPVEVVQGDLGTDSEDVGNWLMAEADPKPEVEMQITNAVVSGSDVSVTVQGRVTDKLSNYAATAGEKVQSLRFIVDDEELHSINITGSVGSGFDFNETITIPNVKPRGYTLRAETSENLAGNQGWDQVALGVAYVEDPPAFPEDRGEFAISFAQNPTDTTIDTVTVYFGDRDPQAGDLTAIESAAGSCEFIGNVQVTIDGQAQSVPCKISAKGPFSFAANAVDNIDAQITYTVPGIGENKLHGRWTETAANSLVFKSSGYQAGDERLIVEATADLQGSKNEDFEPITLRMMTGSDDWENSNTVRIKVGGTEYPLKKFTFNGKEALYPYDETYPDKPKQFLPSAKSVPLKLETPGYSSGDGSFEFKLKIGSSEHDLQTVQVQRGFRNDFFVQAPPAAAAPLVFQAAAAPAGWKKKGDTVTWKDLMDAYEWIYGTNETAMTLLNTYKEHHWIELTNVLGDLDVHYRHRIGPDRDVVIQIEHNDDDINPVVCAQLLYAGLHRALAYGSVAQHYDDINIIVAARKAFAKKAAEITATSAELYISGISIINEGLDWALIVSDVAEGQYASLAAALPLIPVAAVRTGGKMIFRTPQGKILGEITNRDQLDAIYWASKKRAYADKVKILEDAGVSDDMIDMLVRGGEIQYSKAHKVLKSRMIKAGNKKPGRNYQAHHDLPWEFREWFAAHKIDVNDAQYGRWVHIDDHKKWHNEEPKFNDIWEDFIYDANGNQIKRSKDEIMIKLNEIRASYQKTQ